MKYAFITLLVFGCKLDNNEYRYKGLPEGVTVTCEESFSTSKRQCAGNDGVLYTCILSNETYHDVAGGCASVPNTRVCGRAVR